MANFIFSTGIRMETNRLEQESALLLELEERHRSTKKGVGRWLVAMVVVGALGFGGYRLWRSAKSAAADATTQSAESGGRGRGGRGGGRGAGGRTAVVAVAARKVDMPVYLR